MMLPVITISIPRLVSLGLDPLTRYDVEKSDVDGVTLAKQYSTK